jgi:hypothetical protein
VCAAEQQRSSVSIAATHTQQHTMLAHSMLGAGRATQGHAWPRTQQFRA